MLQKFIFIILLSVASHATCSDEALPDIPGEILEKILIELPAKSYIRCARISKMFFEFVHYDKNKRLVLETEKIKLDPVITYVVSLSGTRKIDQACYKKYADKFCPLITQYLNLLKTLKYSAPLDTVINIDPWKSITFGEHYDFLRQLARTMKVAIPVSFTSFRLALNPEVMSHLQAVADREHFYRQRRAGIGRAVGFISTPHTPTALGAQ